MLRRSVWAVAVSLFALVLAPSTIAAAPPEEQQLSQEGTYQISATSDWVTWPRRSLADGWVLWHGGTFLPSPEPYTTNLGTDAKGRAVALDQPCGRCRVVERRLADGSVRPLRRRVLHAADESRGTLAFVRFGGGIYVLRPRARRVVRVSRMDAAKVALSGRWLVYWDNAGSDTAVGAVDLNRSKPRDRVLAKDNADDREYTDMPTWVDQGSPTINGRFAYWRELKGTKGDGSHPAITETRILRVDLNAKHPVVEAFSPARMVDVFAVAGGAIYYAPLPFTASGEGVFRVAVPKWRKTTLRLPVRS